MSGKKGDQPQDSWPQDDIKNFVNPGLRLSVVKTVQIVNVDGLFRGSQVGSGRRREKIAGQNQPGGHNRPS
jgi:hypothetical protein